MEHVNGWCFRGIYKGGLWENDLHVSAHPHDGCADKDSYPHDKNVTDDLCSLLKLCFAFIMVLWLFFRLNVFYCY